MINGSAMHLAEIDKAAKEFVEKRLRRTPKRGQARRAKDMYQAYVAGASVWAELYEHQVQMRLQDRRDDAQNLANWVK